MDPLPLAVAAETKGGSGGEELTDGEEEGDEGAIDPLACLNVCLTESVIVCFKVLDVLDDNEDDDDADEFRTCNFLWGIMVAVVDVG